MSGLLPSEGQSISKEVPVSVRRRYWKMPHVKGHTEVMMISIICMAF